MVNTSLAWRFADVNIICCALWAIYSACVLLPYQASLLCASLPGLGLGSLTGSLRDVQFGDCGFLYIEFQTRATLYTMPAPTEADAMLLA